MSSRINISGLSTGIQWGDLVDSTVKAYEARQVTPITDRITKRAAQKTAWTKMQGLVETLNTNARNLRRSGFGGFLATVPPSPSTSRALLTATASLTATPGRYRVEVLQLADTAKIAGHAVADTTAARALTGSMAINGTSITLVPADTLVDIRTKINDANLGGFVIYHAPKLKIFMDDRFELCGDAWLMNYVETIRDHPERFEDWYQEYRFEVAIVAASTPMLPLENAMRTSGHWREIARDCTAVMYRRIDFIRTPQ